MRPRYLVAALLTASVVGAVVVVTGFLTDRGVGEEPLSTWVIPTTTPSPTPGPSPTPEPPLDLAADVTVDVDGFLRWAALDREAGELVGSEGSSETSTTESMIKIWVIADYLRRHTEDGTEPSEEDLADASRAIRDSHNGATEQLYQAGGGNEVVERMIDMCGLTDTEVYPHWWSRTEISAQDAVRLGECVADGTAAGPEWTDWVLDEMRNVRGNTDPDDQPMAGGGEGGHWGIIDGLPAEIVDDGVAIKNGWTAIGRTGNWHIACLAVTDDWVMAVLMQYPAEHGLDYGAERCASVAEQLVPR